MTIPLVDLSWQVAEIRDEVEAGWRRVLETSTFILGPEVEAFEESFAEFCGVGACIGVGNGTDALEIALRALEIGRGDEVIVPANSFIATALAVLRAGAEVKLVDCLPRNYLIDLESAVDARTSRTRAVVPVHLFGQMAPVEKLIGTFPDAFIVEDAAQAQGAERDERRAGSLSPIAATSFYPGKNIGAFGDAGAVLTSDSKLAEKARALRNWGSDRKYHHPVAGFNSRLDALQAVVLSAKLARLEAWNKLRVEAAAYYDDLFRGIERIQNSETLSGNQHVYHLYVVEVDHRDEVVERMHAAEIGVGIHYPVPIHLQGALTHLGYRVGDFPVAEEAAARSLSLPIYPGITRNDQERVAAELLSSTMQRI
ncbi:MAG: DegT/DnrJ/EryC1/StrS family aminotransferase [Acidimicrobiia bacterium]